MTTERPVTPPSFIEAIVNQLEWDEKTDADPRPVVPEGATQNSDSTRIDLSARVKESLVKAVLSSKAGPFAELRAAAASFEAVAGNRPHGPLDDLVVAIKEITGVAGLHQRAGSTARSSLPPVTNDAAVTAQLKNAGAVIIGTAAMHELAFGTTGINQAFGSPANPVDPDRICGGSSSGSAAAVGSGIVDVALGTDTGGSVRIPSALCGVVGFKPSFATYSTSGVLPLSPSLDHVGFHAPNVETILRIHDALVANRESAGTVKRVGIAHYQLDDSASEVADAVRSALFILQAHGLQIIDIELPDPSRVFSVSTAIMFSEAYAVHQRLMAEHAADIGSDVRDRLDAGRSIPASTYVVALQEKAAITGEVIALFSNIDVIVGPTAPIVAPLFSEAITDPSLGGRLVSFTRLANVSGTPAITLPLKSDGLPVGLQIMGESNSSTLQFASLVEKLLKASA